MRTQYQQVSGPNFSGVSSALASSQRSISDGIASIGNSVTNLGKRREARALIAKQEAEARALENFKLNAVNADAQALAAISSGAAPGGALPVGAADYIGQRQRALLDNDSVRASTEGTRATTNKTNEGTRSTRILNDGSQLELDDKQASQNFEREYSADLLAVGNLASQGRGDEAQAVLDRVLGSASSKYSADIVLGTIDAMNARVRDGDTTRNQLADNDLKLRQGEETLRGTGISNNGQILTNNAQRQQNTEAKYIFGRQQSQDQEDDLVAATISRYISGATTPQDALVNVQRDPNLSPEERVRVAAGVQEVLGTPGAIDTFSPIDPLNQNVLDIAKTNPAEGQANFAGVSDFVAGAAEAELRRSPSQQIFRTASEISPETEHVSISKTLKERYPDREFSDSDINRIDAIRRNNNITKREAIAMVDNSIGGRGFGLHSILPGGKTSDDRVFDEEKFQDIVTAYTQEVSQGNLNVGRGQRERDKATAAGLESQYTDAVRARARAIQTGDQAAVARYDQILANLNLQARSLEQGHFNLEDLNRSQAQSTSERFFDPYRNNDGLLNYEDLIGISDKDRELRTRRRLNRGN